VLAVLAARFVPTLQLAAGAILFAAAVGIPAGVICARWPRSWLDAACMAGALAGVSTPVFLLGLILILVGPRVAPWLPVAGYEPWSVRHFLLPCVALGAVPMALLARLTRSSMLDVLGRDFLRTARAKGLTEWAVVLRHGFRPALAPIITVLGTSVASLLSGAVLTETVFSIPGLGREIFDSIQGRDYPVLVGGVMWFACTFVLAGLAVDVLYGWIDPRVRVEGGP
jgi:peptide/nickel transport system permease protein